MNIKLKRIILYPLQRRSRPAGRINFSYIRLLQCEMTFRNSYSMPFNDVTGPVLDGVCSGGCSWNVRPLDVKLTPRCHLPAPLQNKEFVCRGHDYERLEAFQQRMLNEFPHAIAMQHVNQPDQTIYQAEAQCILGYRERHIRHSLTQAWKHASMLSTHSQMCGNA